MKRDSLVLILIGLVSFSILTGMAAGSHPGATPPLGEQEPTETITLTETLHLPLITQPSSFYLPLIVSQPLLVNPHPKDGAERRSLNVYLTWEILDVGLTGLTYTVYLEADDDTPDIPIAVGLSSRALDPFTFEADTLYYWQVVAQDANGVRFVGPVWRFRTDYFPAIPELGAMVEIPAGEFLMGCDAANSGYQCFTNQTPLHPVYLDAFRMDKYEVTNKEYRACVDAGVCYLPRRFNSASRSNYFFNPKYDYYPVVFVSNADARRYCSWVGKRLPTEAEWEKAARGPIDTRPWPWGHEMVDCTRANHPGTPSESSCINPRDTDRIDAYPRGQSPYGVLNIAGNVWEWVQDYYIDGYYQISPYYNPVNDTIHQRIPYYSVRGGCFRNVWWYLRTSHRSGGHWGDNGANDSPLFRSNMYGFRCAQSVTAQEMESQVSSSPGE